MNRPGESRSPTRVLLVSDESPLSLGVEVQLRDRVILEVIRDLDAVKVLECIHAYQPHTIVLGIPCEKGRPPPEWLHIVSDMPDIRLIALSLQDNSVRIYDRGRMQMVADVAGLLEACQATEVGPSLHTPKQLLERRGHQ